MNNGQAMTVEVALDLRQRLEELADSLHQPPERIIDRALREYLDRNDSRTKDRAGTGTTSYIELTLREGRPDFI